MPYAKTNGINMYYEEHGKGEPLLLIMGITAPGSVWEKHVRFGKRITDVLWQTTAGWGILISPPARTLLRRWPTTTLG